MSHNDLTSLLETLAEEVDRMPSRDYSAPAWARARLLRRRRLVLGAAAAVVLVGVPVAVAVLAAHHPVPEPPAVPAYSKTPLRARAAHTTTLLPDGRVLIVGGCATDGCGSSEAAPTTEYYVAGHGFTPGPALAQPRQGHSATLLPDGRVLIVGGWAREGTPPLDSAELYDPRTGRFTPAGRLGTGRGGHSATLLPDGQVLIAGGQTNAGTDTATAELFDPTTNTFTPTAPMPSPRHAGQAIALPDGRVLVAGGRNGDAALASAVLYDPRAHAWRPTGSLATPRDKAAIAPLPDGRVLVLGGTPDDHLLLATTEIYDPRTGRFTPGPTMDTGRYKFSAVTVNAAGCILVAGGWQPAVYSHGRFRPVGGATGPFRLAPTLTVLPDGGVLVLGGYDDRIRVYDDALLIGAPSC